MLLLYTFSKGVQFVLWLSRVSCGFTVFIEHPELGDQQTAETSFDYRFGAWDLGT